jgi:hypothetical protein
MVTPMTDVLSTRWKKRNYAPSYGRSMTWNYLMFNRAYWKTWEVEYKVWTKGTSYNPS